MPNTLTGLLLFAILLLPGFVFLTILRRDRPDRRPSVLQETASIASVSILSDMIALSGFAVLRAFAQNWTPDVGMLIRNPVDYSAEHSLLVFAWSSGVLVVACGVAALVGWLIGRRSAHPSVMSSWWMLFEHWQPDTTRHIECLLDDGTYIAGQLGDWNTLADDSPDRDLILAAPITYRPAGSTEHHPHPVSVVCISARRITAIFVSYVDPATSPEEGAEEEGVAAEEEATAPSEATPLASDPGSPPTAQP
ncbi:MAG: hypothetical protein JO115_00890 [Pseudonocardiales bacterium]|nr:hypothetical protein [Pseudonocardiales bacterium]